MILFITDQFSRAIRLIALHTLPSALQVFKFYGIPEDIMRDQATQFISRVWNGFMERLRIIVSLTTGYHPQANGQVEKMNQEITHYLHTYCGHNEND